MSEKHWVLMHDSTSQTEYLGKTDKTDEEIAAAAKEGFVVLEECRCLRTLIIPGPQGVTQSNILMSNSIARGGVDMRIRPTAWWWPEGDKYAMDVISKQVTTCEQRELAARAEESGLVTPSGNSVSEDLARQIQQREGLKRRS